MGTASAQERREEGKHQGPHTPPTPERARLFPSRTPDGPSGTASLAGLAVLRALAPVNRATFLALRAETNLPSASLLGVLLRLRGADLITVEVESTGSSRMAFALSEAKRTVLSAAGTTLSVVPPSEQRRFSASLAKLAGRPSVGPAPLDVHEGRTRDEADGQETPETAPDEPQKAPFAQGAPGRSPGPSHQSVARGRNDGLKEPTDPAVLLCASGVRSRNESCRTAHRAEGRVPGRLAALLDAAPPFPSGPEGTKGEAR